MRLKHFLLSLSLALIGVNLVWTQSNSVDVDYGDTDYNVGPAPARVAPLTFGGPDGPRRQVSIYDGDTRATDEPKYPPSSFPGTGTIPEHLLVDGETNCLRDCYPHSSKYCHFKFVVAYDNVLDPAYCGDCPSILNDCNRKGCIPADGVPRSLVVANKLLPGPSIRVCQNDVVVVDVINHLNVSTSIHWHGIHQKKCPIPPYQSFRYEFDVPVEGTYFWHSHSFVQRGDGLFGSLIVRKPIQYELYGPASIHHLYDLDLPLHEIIVMDWQNRTQDEVLASTIRHEGMLFRPTNVLVNGKGYDHRNESIGNPPMPIYEMSVQSGKKYRVRIIGNGVISCPIQITFDNHTMIVIASDGFDVQPVKVDSLVIYAGERWDVVVNAVQASGTYWIKFRGLNTCAFNGTPDYQVGVLNYQDQPLGQIPSTPISRWRDTGPTKGARVINLLNYGPGGDRNLTVVELHSVQDDDPWIIEQKDADYKLFIHNDFNPVEPENHKPHSVALRNGTSYTPQMNLISYVPPKAPPLTQPEIISRLYVCNSTDTFHLTRPDHRQIRYDCNETYCACTHIVKVKLNSIVEMILVDAAVPLMGNHPFHLHGHSFRVVGMGKLGNSTSVEKVKKLDKLHLLARRRHDAPIKDTVTVPAGGYTILRFRADNPGFWFFHCHVDFHVEVGMGLIVQVGEIEEMIPAPHNFPKCGPIIQPKPHPDHGHAWGWTPVLKTVPALVPVIHYKHHFFRQPW